MFKNDKAKDGWRLLKNIPFDGKKFIPEIVKCQKTGMVSVKGEVMRGRAKKHVRLGQHHAEWLLEHQGLIPKELRGKCLNFLGTVWLDNEGFHSGPFLYWHSGKWHLCFSWLMCCWRDRALLFSSRDNSVWLFGGLRGNSVWPFSLRDRVWSPFSSCE